ncbi:MAG: ABC transporter substrate-binding protein [Candidatus Binatia bacterium]
MKRPISVCMLVILLAGPSIALAQSTSRADLIEGAKKEGKLAIYSVLAVPDHTQVIEAFKQKYPFIDVSLWRPSGAGEGVATRVMTEAAANTYLVDVIGIDQPLMSHLIKRNLMMRYESPERESFEPAFKDKQGHWTAFYLNPKVIPYNTKVVRAEDAPKTYSDLLDPKWKGRLVMEDTEGGWFGSLCLYWGEKKTVDYMRQLAKQNFTMRSGHTLITMLIAAGEYPGAVVSNGPRVELTKLRGAPLDWNPPDPTVVSITTIGAAARAPHPNSAKLYLDHVLSREIQEGYIEKKFVKPSARKGVVSSFMEKVKRTGVKMIPLDVGSPEALNDFQKRYMEIFKH